MASPRQKLIAATNLLSKYYGLPILEDLLTAEALKGVTGQAGQPANVNESDKLLDTIIANFINSSSGALTSNQLINRFNDLLKDNQIAEDRFNEIFQIFFVGAKNLITGTTADFTEEDRTISRPPITGILEYEGSDQGQLGTTINSTYAAPTKESPSLSVILCNSPRIGLAGRDINAVTIFLNGIPNVEISRATPFINIEFFFPRPAIGGGDKGRLQTLSLSKFLLGAEQVDGGTSALATIAQAGQTGQATVNDETGEVNTDDVHATAGMELFCSPQSLVNADATDAPELRAVPILDKFRPLMTLESLEITVAPSTGLMSFKTGELKFTLHDRSRLAEIAEFVRADLYGKTDIMIEYGWSHPDGQSVIGSNNPYGDLINGMKVKEKYQVINSSFTFDDVGQIIVTLKLAMKGAIDFDTELIASDSDSVASVIKEIEELQRLVGDYRERIFSNTVTARSKEVRGIQVLDAAQDAIGQVSAGKKLRDEMKQFRRSLKQSKNNPDAQRLIEALNSLFGKEKKSTGAVKNLRNTILKSINNKMNKLEANGRDPFLIDDDSKKKTGQRKIVDAKNSKAKRKFKQLTKLTTNVSGIKLGSEVSLAKILLNFVAEPLANTAKFDDIQFVFYPFNRYAGTASKLNIGNFAVNLKFFTEEFQRYRLDHIAKSGNMNLSDFLDFLADIVLDDPGARSYGLFDDNGAFYKNVYNDDGTQRSAQIVDNIPDYQVRLEAKLKRYTPDGSWKMPQVDFFIESLTEAVGEVLGQDATINTSRTILRIHVFDRQTNSYDTLQALLASTRDSEIEAINNATPPASPDTANVGVDKEYARNAVAILEAASTSNLIEPIPSDDPDLPTKYRIIGSPRELKEFMMRTMPYVIYGTAGTTIKTANLSSIQDSKLATVNLLRSFNKTELQPNGENPGGLPMRIIPTELNLNGMGCPLINFAQQFFCDFQTGTTADAIYAVVGLTHSFQPGEFTSNIKLAPLDGWGRYMSLVQRVGQAAEILKDIDKQRDS